MIFFEALTMIDDHRSDDSRVELSHELLSLDDVCVCLQLKITGDDHLQKPVEQH